MTSPEIHFFIRLMIVSCGAVMLFIAAGLWVELRRYPKPQPPTDAVEIIFGVMCFVIGALMVAVGVVMK